MTSLDDPTTGTQRLIEMTGQRININTVAAGKEKP
jgi:hypothetical protein